VKGVDTTTMQRQGAVRYQGWPRAGRSARGALVPLAAARNAQAGQRCFDLWPDVATRRGRALRPPRSCWRAARPPRSQRPSTPRPTQRHFTWMRDSAWTGCSAALRGEGLNPSGLRRHHTVLADCAPPLPLPAVGWRMRVADWTLLSAHEITAIRLPARPRPAGGGGVGLRLHDGRKYTSPRAWTLVAFLKRTPMGGCTVMLRRADVVVAAGTHDLGDDLLAGGVRRGRVGRTSGAASAQTRRAAGGGGGWRRPWRAPGEARRYRPTPRQVGYRSALGALHPLNKTINIDQYGHPGARMSLFGGSRPWRAVVPGTRRSPSASSTRRVVHEVAITLPAAHRAGGRARAPARRRRAGDEPQVDELPAGEVAASARR